MGFKIGIDVGGTFTDFLVVDEQGNSKIHKTSTTPSDPAIGLMNGLAEIAALEGISIKNFLSQVDRIVHGTTVTTNAVLTGNYVKTGFVTTKGFREYLNDRTGIKRTPYDVKEDPPIPIVPRRLIMTVAERIDCEGNEITPLKEEDVYAAAQVFKREKVEAIAVCLLFSFLNPSHELMVKEILEKQLPGVYVCISSKVLPQVRIYPRASTTVFNACVGPILRRYIDSLMLKLRQNGFNKTFLLMQSNGGVMSPEVAMEYACNTLLSGPAGGTQASLLYGQIHKINNMISVDMGGTSFDVCLMRDTKPEMTVENEVGEYRLAVSSIAIHSIGAGGGSIAHVDPGGILRVGPKSAGAVPGPVCYDLGGEEPTVTDADLTLGYLNPDYYLGSRKKIYPDKAKKAIGEKIAQPLGLDVIEAAYGIYTMINENMVQGVKTESISKGYDPRTAMLIAAGGAGPLHCCDIAKELEMQTIFIPSVSSVFCATGMLLSSLRHDFVKVCYMLMNKERIDLELINSSYKEMRTSGFNVLEKEGIPKEKREVFYSADLRYEGQFTEISVPVSFHNSSITLDDLPLLLKAFDKKHDELYGYSLPDTNVELLCLRVVVEGYTDKIQLTEMPYLGEDSTAAVKEKRKIYYDRHFITVPIYDGTKIGNGNRIQGPAIVEEPTTNILITPDYQLTCDKYNNFILFPADKSFEEALSQLRKY